MVRGRFYLGLFCNLMNGHHGAVQTSGSGAEGEHGEPLSAVPGDGEGGAAAALGQTLLAPPPLRVHVHRAGRVAGLDHHRGGAGAGVPVLPQTRGPAVVAEGGGVQNLRP